CATSSSLFGTLLLCFGSGCRVCWTGFGCQVAHNLMDSLLGEGHRYGSGCRVAYCSATEGSDGDASGER
ncbi:hypothetical protein U1Q18_050710, partial [Sarracenia purpurea var. burkii]